MEDIKFELICENCGVEYSLETYEIEMKDPPQYCPFCAAEIDLSTLDDDEYDEMEFDDE